MTPIGTPGNRRMAMLIDGDNAQPSLIEKMLAETSKYGLITIRRIYGDWTASNMGGWKEMLQTYAIQPIQQFRYTIGKNATDSAMIIDAMDILYGGGVDAFCLVSSDSDYTRLATRIRETGIFVMGLGEKKTPKPFVNACDVFVYTENLVTEKKKPRPATKKKSDDKHTKADKAEVEKAEADKSEADPMPILEQAFEMAVREDGWARLDVMGTNLYQLDPSFDPRTYGQKQLSRLVRSLKDAFEMRSQEIDGSILIYVKMKE